jgi:DNA polymerase elongation subunit (family B)
MINVPLNKLLFFDLETVGVEKDLPTLRKNRPELARLFESYLDWFVKKYPEQEGNTPEEIFVNKAALVSEFSKIIVASFSFITPKGDIHTQTFAEDDEKDLLLQVRDLLNKVEKLDFYLCGHNIKFFDIPTLGKRFLTHGILPPKILPSYETKPWEIKAVDTKEVWQFGNNFGISSLDLMCVSMGIESPKTGEVSGNLVHDTYWNANGLTPIAEYCEKDVNVLVELMKKIYNLK